MEELYAFVSLRCQLANSMKAVGGKDAMKAVEKIDEHIHTLVKRHIDNQNQGVAKAPTLTKDEISI